MKVKFSRYSGYFSNNNSDGQKALENALGVSTRSTPIPTSEASTPSSRNRVHPLFISRIFGLRGSGSSANSTLIGNGFTTVRCSSRFTVKCSQSMRDSSARSTVARNVVAVRLDVEANQVSSQQSI